MYEPSRAKSVHAMAEPQFPHRSREEELDIQLAGHLAALLAVTDELRGLSSDGTAGPEPDLDSASSRIADEVARLRRERRPRPGAPSEMPPRDGARVVDLHRQA
ncbi:SCO4983 family protein, partial [Streptomyces meridianus]